MFFLLITSDCNCQMYLSNIIAGRVVNIISHCAIFPLPGVSIYGATKAALRAWTISSRIELKDHGVKLITFSPGKFKSIIQEILLFIMLNSRVVFYAFFHYVW